ncbi:MAG: CotH kinase family protein [Oligoflexus sp.]|jgi:spore coat protein H
MHRGMQLCLAVSLLNLWACRSLPMKEINSYGLQLVSVDLKAEDMGRLNSQVQSKRPVAATIRIAGSMRTQCQVSYAGRSSLDAYRKSFELDFCDQTYRGRESYRLSAQSVDRTMLRSLVGYPIFQAVELKTPEVEAAAAYVNKDYLGLYLLLETVDREFYGKRKVAVREIYKARFGNAGFQRDFLNRLSEAFSVEDKPDNYTFLKELYEALWSIDDDAVFYRRADQLLDIDNFLRYMAAAVFVCHWDGLNNNYYLGYELERQKLVTTPWDLDRIWERTGVFTPQSVISINALLVRLLKIPEVRARWIEILDLLTTRFPLEQLKGEVDRLGELTAQAYAKDPILSRKTQSEELDELKDRMEEWYEKIQDYRRQIAIE